MAKFKNNRAPGAVGPKAKPKPKPKPKPRKKGVTNE
jgi:hypothetical protein